MTYSALYTGDVCILCGRLLTVHDVHGTHPRHCAECKRECDRAHQSLFLPESLVEFPNSGQSVSPNPIGAAPNTFGGGNGNLQAACADSGERLTGLSETK